MREHGCTHAWGKGTHMKRHGYMNTVARMHEERTRTKRHGCMNTAARMHGEGARTQRLGWTDDQGK
eukprot:337482-Chlamydomonas_euryale.AAC.3